MARYLRELAANAVFVAVVALTVAVMACYRLADPEAVYEEAGKPATGRWQYGMPPAPRDVVDGERAGRATFAGKEGQ